LDGAFEMAGATGLEPATSGVTGSCEMSDFNDLKYLGYQNVIKCVKSLGVSAPYLHPESDSSRGPYPGQEKSGDPHHLGPRKPLRVLRGDGNNLNQKNP
jgi:hypothetical protein